MRKKIILGYILTLSLVFVVTAACFAPAFASMTYFDHASTDGKTIIDIAGHQPPIQIVAIHFDGGDHGVGDFLEVSTYQYIPALGRSVWATVAAITDSPSRAAFLKDFVFADLPGVPRTILLVKNSQLQICRIGKFVSAIWTVPITSPSVTLPPGYLLFRGYGPAQTDHTVHSLPNGVTITNDKTSFASSVTFICPIWKYFGPVVNEDTTIGIDIDSVVTHV